MISLKGSDSAKMAPNKDILAFCIKSTLQKKETTQDLVFQKYVLVLKRARLLAGLSHCWPGSSDVHLFVGFCVCTPTKLHKYIERSLPVSHHYKTHYQAFVIGPFRRISHHSEVFL